MRYRRTDVKGGTYFFTVNLAQRHLRLLLDHVEILREAVRTVKQRHPFQIDAFVVLPDHLHAIRYGLYRLTMRIFQRDGC